MMKAGAGDSDVSDASRFIGPLSSPGDPWLFGRSVLVWLWGRGEDMLGGEEYDPVQSFAHLILCTSDVQVSEQGIAQPTGR